MKNQRERRRRLNLRKIVSAFFAGFFIISLLNTYNSFAAANIFKIQNAELIELSENAEGSISSFNELEIKSNVTFHKVGDTAKYKLIIKNSGTDDVLINQISDM